MGEAPGSGLPWVEKYRPATLRDVAAHTDIIDTGARPPRPPPPPAPPALPPLLSSRSPRLCPARFRPPLGLPRLLSGRLTPSAPPRSPGSRASARQ